MMARVAIQSRRRRIPPQLKDLNVWVLWDLRSKTPLAPWTTGDMFRAGWGDGVVDNPDSRMTERPETDYTTANAFAELPTQELHKTHNFPTTDENGVPIDDPIPPRIEVTILLPHYPKERGLQPRLMYIDFDDVRDPDTGEVDPEVADIIDRLDSYTEISSSGTGIHVLVWANLRDDLGMINEPLDGEGSIEMYDHSRFFAGTWRHVEGTPTDINERQDIVDELIEKYGPEPGSVGNGSSRLSANRANDSNQNLSVQDRIDEITNPTGASGDSPYFDADIEDFARPKDTVKEEVNNSSGGKPGPQGSHPVHGKTKSKTTNSTNYHIDPGENRWWCFAHQRGGGSMEMAAVMAGEMQCSDVGEGSLENLSDVEFLKVCLYARDTLGFDSDAKPPYRALATIADLLELPMDDADRGILGSATYRSARVIYDGLAVDDVTDLA